MKVKLGLLAVALTAVMSVPCNATSSHYVGKLMYSPDPDGRHMTLLADFGFVDADGSQWPVPKGAMTDGASIPQPFWSVMGGPFEGKYRDAAVIHDYYCDVRIRPWQAVDRMFYDAMIISGVGPIEAKIMYAAVREFGPDWDGQTMVNSKLRADATKAVLPGQSHLAIAVMTSEGRAIQMPASLAEEAPVIAESALTSSASIAPGWVTSPGSTGSSSAWIVKPFAAVPIFKKGPVPTREQFDAIAKQIRTTNPSLDQIDQLYAPR